MVKKKKKKPQFKIWLEAPKKFGMALYTFTINSSPPMLARRNDAINLKNPKFALPKICVIDLQIT